METEKNGVERAIEKAGSGGSIYSGANVLAALLGCKIQFIYTSKRKGWLPVDKARIVSDTYGIPLVDLVKADVRAALNANS